MLLYLTSNQKSNLIDPAVRNMTLPAKKLVGRFSLKSFVTKDMRNYANAKFFVVDAACIEESGNDFTLALQSFQMMFSARIIVILSGYEDVNGEVQRLLSIGVVNLVTGETMEDALDELTEALSEDGMQRYVVKAPVYEQPATQREKAPEPDEIIPYRWNARNIRIAVAGSQRRSGVTVTAFNLASWLAARGAEVAYIEVNQNRHLQLLLNMQHIGILTDGTVVIVTRRDRVGPVFRYPIDFWGFLRTANKPKKLEWREYKEVYPNLPIFLPPKATEQKIILKKDSLTILGAVFTPPFTLSQLAEKLGPARIVLQNGTRKSPITGRESPYTQALALWDELGLQGWLDEDEQTIKTLGVRVAAQGEYAVRQTFDGTVWIGSKDYREASWKDFAGFAHTLKLGGFTVYTRLPGPVSEEQSAQKAKLEALSAMVQISWKEPEQKAAKAQKFVKGQYYRADPTTRICIERKQANVMENVAWRKFVWNIGADYICIMATFCSFSYFGNDRKRCPFNRI